MKAHEGYLMIDHRASPGTPQVPGGTLFEAAAMQCAHCNSVNIRNPGRTRERASCFKCGGMYVCDNCALEMKQPDYIHNPYIYRRDSYLENIIKKEIHG